MKFPDLIKVRGYNPIVDADLSEVNKAVELLLKAERPIIMAGGGVILSGAFSELQALAELLMIPVVTTFKGKGAFPREPSAGDGSDRHARPCGGKQDNS